MKFARVVFLVAGIYGLIVVAPQYFMEAKTGRDFPPPITHPEFYYGTRVLSKVNSNMKERPTLRLERIALS
jgi:hypothetical protein